MIVLIGMRTVFYTPIFKNIYNMSHKTSLPFTPYLPQNIYMM